MISENRSCKTHWSLFLSLSLSFSPCKLWNGWNCTWVCEVALRWKRRQGVLGRRSYTEMHYCTLKDPKQIDHMPVSLPIVIKEMSQLKRIRLRILLSNTAFLSTVHAGKWPLQFLFYPHFATRRWTNGFMAWLQELCFSQIFRAFSSEG